MTLFETFLQTLYYLLMKLFSNTSDPFVIKHMTEWWIGRGWNWTPSLVINGSCNAGDTSAKITLSRGESRQTQTWWKYMSLPTDISMRLVSVFGCCWNYHLREERINTRLVILGVYEISTPWNYECRLWLCCEEIRSFTPYIVYQMSTRTLIPNDSYFFLY